MLVPRFELHMVLKAREGEADVLPRRAAAVRRAERGARDAEVRPESVKACMSGAAPLPQAVAEKFREITGGAKLVEGYGLTECSPVTHVNPFDGARTAGIDRDADPRHRLQDRGPGRPDREVEPGEPGELCIKGPQVMLGYWNRPDETDR